VHRALSKAAPAVSSIEVTPFLKPRLAVLPFENLSPDPDNAFFADRLHEEIIRTIAERLPGGSRERCEGRPCRAGLRPATAEDTLEQPVPGHPDRRGSDVYGRVLTGAADCPDRPGKRLAAGELEGQ
jgi:hypothetical protein